MGYIENQTIEALSSSFAGIDIRATFTVAEMEPVAGSIHRGKVDVTFGTLYFECKVFYDADQKRAFIDADETKKIIQEALRYKAENG